MGRLAVTWSFATKTSVDGKVSGPGNYGFQDMVAVIQNPQIAHYTPRASLGDLQEAFRTRWMHGLNTKSPWSFVRDVIEKDYRQFLPIPWFIGEYGASGRDEAMIQADLESMQAHALSGHAFMGAAFLQFQTNYLKGGAAMDFGMFGLADKVLGQTSEVCEPGHGCRSWPVHCLTTELAWLSGSKAHRAQAVAAAWGGSIDQSSLCPRERRLSSVGTKLSCQIRADAFAEGANAVAAVLGTQTFSDHIQSRIANVVGNSGAALQGDVTFTRIAAWRGLGELGRAVQTSSPRHHGLCGPSLPLQACCCCSWQGALWPAGGREIRDLAQQVSRRYEQSICRRWPSIVVTLGVRYGLICLANLHVHREAARVLPWYFAPRP